MDIEAVKAVLQSHDAGFVLDDFEADEATGGHREGFLDRVRFKLSRRADLPDVAREEVFGCAHKLGQLLTVRLVSSHGLGEAQRRCVAIVEDLRKDARWSAFEAVIRSWPSVIAHEVDRLVADLEGRPADPAAPRQPPSAETVLFQLRDAVETLLKVPALVLARALIEWGTPEDARQVRNDCFGRLSGGEWLGLANDWAERAATQPVLGRLHALARLFDKRGAIYLMFNGFNALRNSEIGHGAHRLDPAETADLLRVAVLGDVAAASRLNMSPTMPLADALRAAVDRSPSPWAGMQLVAGEDGGAIVLTGAEPLSAWHRNPAHGPGTEKHHEREMPVRLVFAEGEALELGPFVRARICERCTYRDVFLFDALNDAKSDGQFALLDYGRGHRMRPRGRRVPDLMAALRAADPVVRPPRVEGALSSRDVVEHLDAARVDRRYRSPTYLRARLAAFLRERSRGVYWLQAPAHVGKTTLVQGLDGFDSEPLIARSEPAAVAVAAFFFKREYREGAATFVNGFERAIERALDIRTDANAEKPTAGQVVSAADRAGAFAAWLDEWRDFAKAQHGLAERPRLLLAVDGIDETDPPERSDSPLHLLPRPEQLSAGLYLLLTSRRPQDADCPRWLGAAVAPRVGAGPDAVTHFIGLDDPGYRSLLRSYAAGRLGRSADKSFDALFQTVLAKAEGRSVYVAFIVDRLLRGAVPIDQIDALAVGDALYRDFLDRLDVEFHPKLADAIRDVLLVLAAEERAHDWMHSDGAQTDRATGGILRPVSEQWPGLPLDALARHAALDSAGGGYDDRFVEILLSLQGVLAVSRGEVGAPRYRLGLKGLTDQIAAHPLLGWRLAPVHGHLATIALDALDVLAADDGGMEEKTAREEFTERAVHLVPHIRLSRSDLPAARWDLSKGVRAVNETADKSLGTGRYGDAITWCNLWLWWREEQLCARGKTGLAGSQDAADENDLARAYMNRGVAKQAAPGHGVLATIADYDAAIAIRKRLRETLGERWPEPWRNDLAAAYMNRGVARRSAPGHGALAAIGDYDAAIAIRERLREAHGKGWPESWRNDLATAYTNRGVAKLDAPGHGALAAIADYDAAIAIREGMREALGEGWPVPWRNDLAVAYVNRGTAKQAAPGHGPQAAIDDYDAAIALMEGLRKTLGDSWPDPWRNDLAGAYVNRGLARQNAPGHGVLAAIADYDAAIVIREGLREALGEGCPVPWRKDLAVAYANRGAVRQDAPGHGGLAAITDYDAAIAIMEGLREVLGEGWPVPWRNDLANACMNRANAKQAAPGYGALAAIADYDVALAIMERLRETLGEGWPMPWRNDLARAYMNRGKAKETAPGHGPLSAIADYDTAIAIREGLREALGESWPMPWRNNLANAYVNRGNAKQVAPGHGALAAIVDYDAAIAIRQELRKALGESWPMPWRNDLAEAHVGRGNAKQAAPEQGAPAAIADYDTAIAIMEGLCNALGEGWPMPWRNDLAKAYTNRGNAKQAAPGHGALAAISDHDAAIAIMERLRNALAKAWPVPWRNDLANAYVNRGNAKQAAPGNGALPAIADYDAALAIMEALRQTLGQEWPLPWRNDLAKAYTNRGNAKQAAPGHGVLAAIADHYADREIKKGLREGLGEG